MTKPNKTRKLVYAALGLSESYLAKEKGSERTQSAVETLLGINRKPINRENKRQIENATNDNQKPS